MPTTARRRFQSATGWSEPCAFVPVEELTVLRTWHPNVLIAGLPGATAAALSALRPVFRPSVITWRAGSPLAIPPSAAPGTLILDEVAALSALEQERLFMWLQQNNGVTQVVATTSWPLLQLVDHGSFDAALYYSLNVIYLEVSV